MFIYEPVTYIIYINNHNIYELSIQLIANITSKTIADLKNYLEYHLYFSCAVLDDKPSDSSSDEYTLYRLNQVLNRKYMFKKLKSNNNIFLNIYVNTFDFR